MLSKLSFALGLSVFVLACQNPPKKTAVKPIKQKLRARARATAILKDKPLKWLKGSDWSGGKQRRLALLLAADTFVDPTMNIAFTGNNLRAMKATLRQHCGFSKDSIKTLSGKALVRDAIEAQLRELVKSANAKENLLLIYFTGHGFIDAQGQASFFTYFTEQSSTGTWDKVFTRAELASCCSRARREVEKKGGSLRILVVVDACRTRTMAPPPKARLVAAYDWEIFGTGEGMLALPPSGDEPSPYTMAFTESLKSFSQASRQASLKEVFEDSSRRVKTLTKNKQVPQFLDSQSGERGPRLIVADRVNFGVEVIDALTKLRIPKSRVLLDSRGALDEGGIFSLSGSPSRHLLKVSARGFLSRSNDLTLTDKEKGKLLQVPLLPSLVLVKGRIEPVQVAKISVTGDWSQLRKGYHRTETMCDSTGNFQVKIPALMKGSKLNIEIGGEIVQRVSLPKQVSYYEQQPGQSHDDLGVVDLGSLIIDRGDTKKRSLILKLSEQEKMVMPLPKSLRSAPGEAPRFSDKFGQQDWNRAVLALKAKKWSLALRQMERLKGKSSGSQLKRWQRWVEFQSLRGLDDAALQKRAVELKKQLKHALSQGAAALWLERMLTRAHDLAGSGGAGLSSLVVSIADCEVAFRQAGELRQSSRKERFSVVSTAIKFWLKTSQHSALLVFIKDLNERPRWSTDKLWMALKEESLAGALTPLLTAALDEGKRTGRWSSADQLCALFSSQAESWRVRNTRLGQLVKLVKQEHISLNTRTEFNKAQSFFAGGQWVLSYDSYQRALKGCNQFYQRLIMRQIQFLDEKLAQRLINEGFEHEFEGRIKEAILSYEKALRHAPQVSERVMGLLTEQQSLELIAIGKRLSSKIKGVREHSMAALRDRLLWNKLSNSHQDLIIKYVAKKLRSDYKWIRTKQYNCQDLGHRIATFKHLKSGLLLNLIPGGSYKSLNKTITVKPMLIGCFEVRQSCRTPFLGYRWDNFEFKGAHLPVHDVSQRSVRSWLPGGLRLPTEAEWEYACRAGSTTRYFWGDKMDDSYCWYKKNCSDAGQAKTREVYLHFNNKKWNAFGLVDMSGNVSEYCQYSKRARGGSWRDSAYRCQSSYRYEDEDNKFGGDNQGFRVARSVPD
jgi:tetratricopeptide (TPR) repeat protein